MAGQLAIYAAATGGSLLVGAALGAFRAPPRTLTAGMLAFAAGALIVAVAFELFQPAHREAGLTRASIALVLGASTFIAVDLMLARKAGAGAVGLALVAAVTLDGVPENFALGVSVVEGGSLALLASIVTSNLPESFGGAAEMREGGMSRVRVLTVWAVTAALLVVALVAGRFAADGLSEQWLGTLAAFAAGAVLASVADSVMPEAYAKGGPLVAFATSAGFLVAYALTTVD
jgi:zinc transporter, ZIP family